MAASDPISRAPRAHCSVRFTEHRFAPDLPATTGVDFKVQLMDAKDSIKVNLSLWDTAGATSRQLELALLPSSC